MRLELGGQSYTNNSLVSVEEIGELNREPGALKCVTTNPNCTTVESCNRTWNYPNGTSVSEISNPLYISRENQSVLLNRPNGTVAPTGIYRCELPDGDSNKQQLYVGIYGESEGKHNTNKEGGAKACCHASYSAWVGFNHQLPLCIGDGLTTDGASENQFVSMGIAYLITNT